MANSNQYFDQNSICICCENLKLAALIYDKILPISKYDPITKNKIELETDVPKEILYPDDYQGNLRQIKINAENGLAQVYVSYDLGKNEPLKESKWHFQDSEGFVNQFTYELFEIYLRTKVLEKNKLNYSIIPPNGYNTLISQSISSKDTLGLTFTNLDIIDTSKADWQQILEFKKDKDSLRKFRRFKLFFYEELENKDINHINDLIQIKMEDYQNSCRKHGFEMIEKTYKTILNSKIILAGFSSSIASLIFNNPELFQLSAIGTGILEIGRISIQVSSERIERKIIRNASEISYFIKARKNF